MTKHIPDWPRMMRKATACAYTDLSAAEFEREIVAGRLPAPVQLGNAPHWSRADLDAALERLTGHALEDWREQSPLYANG